MKDTILIATNGRYKDIGMSSQVFKQGNSYKVCDAWRICIEVVPFPTHRIIYFN